MSVIGPQGFGPFGPGIVRFPLRRGLGHHFQGGDRLTAHADHSADAVIAGISAADHYDMLTLGLHGCRKVAAAQQVFRGGGQKIDCIEDAFRSLHAFRLQGPGLFGTAAKNDRVVFFTQIGNLQVFSDIDAGPENDAFRLHQLLPARDHALVQLHVGNTVHEQTADPVFPFINGNGMPPFAKGIRRGQAGRAAADHRDFSAAFPDRRLSFHPSLPVSGLNQIQLIIPDCYRVIVLTADTCLLAESGTDPSGKFRKTVGLQ